MTALVTALAASLDPVAFASGLSFAAEPWQATLLRTQRRRVLVCCARQVGKSTITGLRGLHTALYQPGRLVLIISPSQRQSNELLRKVRATYVALGRPRGKLATDNETELEFSNGSRVVSLPATEATSRGYSAARLLILDEAARVDDEIFASVLPMVASDGAIWALSTPWGRRGWFWELHEDPLNGWERHKITVHESAQYPPERIAEVRGALGRYVFQSDYECVFGDTETQLFTTELVRAMVSSAIPPLELQ